ncbi:shikimate dehydrogenase family protein [Kytococcus sp. Marseille-QA3725]
MLTGSPAEVAPHAVVLGHPVAHSLSPVLHRAAWRELGLQDGSYERVDVPAGGLRDVVEELYAERGVTGFSVTMPLKEEALALGDAQAGTSRTARLAAGANTLVLRPGGWQADNTDVPALARVVRRAVPAREGDVTGGEDEVPEVVLLGSGATGRSALLALHACGVRSLSLVVRSEPRPAFLQLAEELGMTVTVLGLDQLAEVVSGRHLVLSTLPVGWWEQLPTPSWTGADEAGSARDLVWVDALYADWPHPWATAVSDAGGHVVSGLHMLVEQAVDQVELMTGRRPTVQGTAAGLPESLRALHRV